MVSEGVVRLRCLIEKYRIITEEELRVFLESQLVESTTLCQKIILDGELHRFLRDIPVTVEERQRLHSYCRSYLPWWYRIILPVCECCLIFSVTTLGYGIGKCIWTQFSRLWKV